MIGAIIGDLAGSIYEFGQFKKLEPVKIKNIIEENSFISDDTILTVAIADAILNKKPYEERLKYYAKKYGNMIPKNIPYFKTMFSQGFTKWANSNEQGTSQGNGAMMRISPVGYLFDRESDVIENARLATIPSHNSPEAIKCASIIALIIFYARKGYAKDEILDKLNVHIKKPRLERANYTCGETIDVCLYSLFNSNSFEESIKKVLSFGGDTDTNACIVGSMAEAMFGIPEALKEKARAKLPQEFKEIIDKAYLSINKEIEK